jgi:hypothetical protein
VVLLEKIMPLLPHDQRRPPAARALPLAVVCEIRPWGTGVGVWARAGRPPPRATNPDMRTGP